MEKLFGIPVNDLMLALLVLFGVGALIMGVVALRNRVVFKIAWRNIPRRWAQTVLIVLGLMLATTLFSASFATGDTLTHSIRSLVVSWLGEVDVIVESEARKPSGGPAYFDMSHYEAIRDRLSSVPEVEGVAPQIHEAVPVMAPATRLGEPQVHLLGIAEERMNGFSRLADERGNTLSLSALSPGQVYISTEVAEELDAVPGDPLQLFLETQPTTVEVFGIYEKGAETAPELSIVMPLARLQALMGAEGTITAVLITSPGDAVEGARHTDSVMSILEPLLEGTGLEADPVKQDALTEAQEIGNMFSSVFLVLGQFSIAAGILLIFLIFVMLAAERKRELGTARAVGAQRGHVIRMFTFEGAAYALMAAAVGSLLGVGVGWAMVRIMGVAFAGQGFELTFAFGWRSVIIAYTLGMAMTFSVVLFSSWRVSRLNIVRAIRDIPEPRNGRRSLKGTLLTGLLPVAGLFFAFLGFQGEQAFSFMMGTSLVIVGVPLLARRFFLPDRAAFTVAGLGLVAWWLLPGSVLDRVLPEMDAGIEMFFMSGIMMVVGAVWTVIYNADVLLSAAVRLIGRLGGLAPALKIAVAYPMQNRLRTGMALAMLSLIVFTLTVLSVIISGNASLFSDTETLTGGYHVQADTGYANPIHDIRAALREVDGLSPNDFEAIGSFTSGNVDLKQEGSEKDPVDWWIRGLDADYTDTTTYKFAMMAEGYESPGEIWRALQDEPGTAVVAAGLVPERSNFNVGDSGPDFSLEGFFREDDALPEVYIQTRDASTGIEERLRVIGVFKETAFFSSSVMTSQDTLNKVLGQTVPARSFIFRLKEPGSADAVAKALESHFMEYGMQATNLAEEIRKIASTNRVLNTLLQGFMGLGLVVGIAALGVIAARSVVERRQQIGVLRALGFQRGMVQLSFLLESSFVALLGIAIGVVLGMALSYNLVAEISQDIEGFEYSIPWANILTVVAIAYGASLLTTFLPARQAARVHPAEALRSV